MFPNIFLPLRRIMGDFIAVNIDKKNVNLKVFHKKILYGIQEIL